MANNDHPFDSESSTAVLEEGGQEVMEDYERDSLIFDDYYGGQDISTSALNVPVQIEDDEPETMEAQFNRLADAWEDETKLLSSMNRIVTNKAHLQIVAMGPDVVPLILKRMRGKPGWWFEALRFLTGQDPVPDSARGRLDAMTEAWLKWGEENGQS
jgi:hypothetical protein